MPQIRRSTKRLSAHKIKDLKRLARTIDSEDLATIRARGQAEFTRHERLRSIVQALRARRLSQGLSLAVVARKSGIAKPNLSRLENNTRAVPTLDTLDRYARAVGMSIEVALMSADAA